MKSYNCHLSFDIIFIDMSLLISKKDWSINGGQILIDLCWKKRVEKIARHIENLDNMSGPCNILVYQCWNLLSSQNKSHKSVSLKNVRNFFISLWPAIKLWWLYWKDWCHKLKHNTVEGYPLVSLLIFVYISAIWT